MNQVPEKLKATLPGWKLALWLVAMPVLAGGVWCACSLIGRYELSWDIWRLRAFRLTAAGIVGAALAAGGMALQGLMRNPLAEPYILGISSGAGVGVLLGLGLGEWLDWPGWIDTPVMAMVGALATSGVVYGVAQRRGRLDPYVLLLSGVIVNVLNGAIIYAILLFLRPNQLLSFIGWGMGRVPDSLWVQPDLVIFCAVWVVGGWAVLMFRGSAFNALALGDEVAASVGVPVHWLRVETFVAVSLMTAGAVALAGPIGFLGLIVPHLCRLAVGPDHRLLAVVCGFAGAIFLMVADTFCRTAGEWFHVAEIPVGIFTAFCGGPFFILLLRRRHREKAA